MKRVQFFSDSQCTRAVYQLVVSLCNLKLYAITVSDYDNVAITDSHNEHVEKSGCCEVVSSPMLQWPNSLDMALCVAAAISNCTPSARCRLDNLPIAFF